MFSWSYVDSSRIDTGHTRSTTPTASVGTNYKLPEEAIGERLSMWDTSVMTAPTPPLGLTQSQLLRLYRRTFVDLQKEVDSYNAPYISRSIVNQVELEMEDASGRLDIPLPRLPVNGFDAGSGQYSQIRISDFIGRVVGRLDEALTAHAEGGASNLLSAGIRKRLAALPPADLHVRAFIEEALLCFDIGCFRAAIILSWCGAVALLQERVVTQHLTAFNSEAARRDSKWKPARTCEDLGRLREFDLLQVLENINVLSKSVKLELEARLKLRNSCGHPTELRVSEANVAAHIESLLLNVFSPLSTAG